MTNARIGSSAEFWLADDAGVLTELEEILSVTPPNPQVDDVEATHFKSPGRRREYISGLIEDGEGVFEMNYVPGSDTDELIREALEAGDDREYKIVVPDGDFGWAISGTCIVKGYERNIPIDDRMTASLTVRFTGETLEEAQPEPTPTPTP
jgi:predicted secreted protein